MSYSANALETLHRIGTPYHPGSAAELRAAPAHVYVVANGPHVLQIGFGRGSRVAGCMRGGLARRHAKAWICAMGEVVFGQSNLYAVLDRHTVEDAKATEAAIHAQLGIGTNQDAATLIEGLNNRGATSLAEINLWLWERVKRSRQYEALSAVEKAMAEELHELVTHGVIRIERRTRWQATSRGDLLEGNTLARAGKAYLIPVFERLTDTYLRYGVHRPTNGEFAAACQTYEYRSKNGPFTLDFPGRAAPTNTAPVLRALAPTAVPMTPGLALIPAAAPRPRRRVLMAPNPPAPADGTRVVLTPQTRLRFLRTEVEGLAPETIIEFRIVNNEGTSSDPRRLDLDFSCTVRALRTFFDFATDKDWNENGVHSWARFPRWAEAYIVRGRLGA